MKFLKLVNEGATPSPSIIGTNVGDILYYNGTSKQICKSSEWSSISGNGNTAIGVCVVPQSHMSDNKARFISLKEMNYNTPENGGTSYQYMYWGYNNSNPTEKTYSGETGVKADIVKDTTRKGISHIDYNTQINGVSIKSDGKPYTENDLINSTYKIIMLPSNKKTEAFTSTTYQCTSDVEGIKWNLQGPPAYAVSPYNTDGSFNEMYAKSYLSDFDGRGNSTKILNTATVDITGSSAVVNSSQIGNFPAATCCNKYHTVGTNQGDWYLPACGELGYIMPRWEEIQSSLKLVSGVVLDSTGSYWSSSEFSNVYADVVVTDSGRTGTSVKHVAAYVRAFLAF